MSNEGQQADDQELTASQEGSWVHSVKKMTYMLKNHDIFKAVEGTEDGSPYKPEGDLATIWKPEVLTTIRVDV